MKKEKRNFNSRTRIPEDSPQYKFGSRLKERMKEKGITQDQLAEMLGVSSDTVKGWCQHYTFPEYPNLGKLCEIFRPYSIDYFYGIVDAPNYDMQFVSDFTGLTPEAVYHLKSKADKWDKRILSVLLSHLESDLAYWDKGFNPEADTGMILSAFLNYFVNSHKLRIIDDYTEIKTNHFTEMPVGDETFRAMKKIGFRLSNETDLLLFQISKDIPAMLDAFKKEFAETYLSNRTYFERNEDNRSYVISERVVEEEREKK